MTTAADGAHKAASTTDWVARVIPGDDGQSAADGNITGVNHRSAI